MTELEWLACTDPNSMLSFLRDKVSDRKLRLFSAACCRRIWNQLRDEQGRQAVEVSERYADGLADKKELAQARAAIRSAGWDAAAARSRRPSWHGPSFIAWCTARQTIATAAREAARSSLWHAATAPISIGSYVGREVGDLTGEQSRQANFLRDIIGNPFRSIAISPSVLSWHDAAAARLAQATYDERHLPAGILDNARLAVLADALEEAGCANADILNHCRGGGEHVRGCWVVDLLLNKS